MRNLRTPLLLCLLMLTVLGTTTGCLSRAIKEGAGLAMGPKGLYREVTPLGTEGAKPLGVYSNFAVGRIHDDFGGKIPPELIANLDDEIITQFKKEGLPVDQSGKTLTMNVRVFYYERDGALGYALGNFEEALAEVQLVDGGSQVAEGIIVGRTTTTSTIGVANKTKGLAKGLAEWISDRYPEDRRIEYP